VTNYGLAQDGLASAGITNYLCLQFTSRNLNKEIFRTAKWLMKPIFLSEWCRFKRHGRMRHIHGGDFRSAFTHSRLVRFLKIQNIWIYKNHAAKLAIPKHAISQC